MIKGKKRAEYLLSAIVEIHNYYFPQNKRDDWDFVKIKQTNVEITTLINKLKENNVNNWVCSVENLPAMQICLFKSVTRNQQLIKFLFCLTEEKEDEFSCSDSFDRSYAEKSNLEYVVVNMNPKFDVISNHYDLYENLED